MLQAWSAVVIIEEEGEAGVRCPAASIKSRKPGVRCPEAGRGEQLHKHLVGFEAAELTKEMFVAKCLLSALLAYQRQ